MRFIGKFLNHDVPNMTVGREARSRIRHVIEGDWQNGVTDSAIKEAISLVGRFVDHDDPETRIYSANGSMQATSRI